ncbi:MAG: hypothetical protein ACJA00_004609 [Myxococcota bacterium]|jgi:hypothetical protein
MVTDEYDVLSSVSGLFEKSQANRQGALVKHAVPVLFTENSKTVLSGAT